MYEKHINTLRTGNIIKGNGTALCLNDVVLIYWQTGQIDCYKRDLTTVNTDTDPYFWVIYSKTDELRQPTLKTGIVSHNRNSGKSQTGTLDNGGYSYAHRSTKGLRVIEVD